jgi:methyl-accepting chemotaxis protein
MTTTTILLVFSILLNVLLLWYISYALKKLLFISDNMGNLMDSMKEFSDHIEKVHSMETYYGDATLENLIKHSKDVVDEIKKYEEIYNLTNETNEGDDLEYGEEED